MSPAKSAGLLRLLASVSHLEGCIAELGVFQGGTLKALAEACPQKTCYGFDTFEGQPKDSWRPIDFHKPGEFGDTSYSAVSAAMPSNVILLRGVFPLTASQVTAKFCFAHVDFDLEKSTEDAIAWLRPRMVPGGIVAFDDWHWQNCLGVDRAIALAALPVVQSAPNQCYWTAPS